MIIHSDCASPHRRVTTKMEYVRRQVWRLTGTQLSHEHTVVKSAILAIYMIRDVVGPVDQKVDRF